MRKLYLLFFYIAFAQVYSQAILNQQETASRTVQDPNAVVLAPGFHATSSVSNPFVAKIGDSTDNSGGGPSNSDAGNGNPSGTTETETNRFHDTRGNIEVNGGGQLQFTLPIALPPGVKSVAPQVNLVYTSGSGNGIAGYGWNISGITAISRIRKNVEKDGEVGGIQLDYTDLYSFNGQRLILKSGEYGKDGAEYVTEKFSNVKIKSVGEVSGQQWQGPEYWEVTFEDGSQAWYGAAVAGASSARTPMEYNIVKWRDAQGNHISYNYSQDAGTNVGRISNIQWGGNETLGKPHFNEITFNYKYRDLKEGSYVGGLKFVQDKILENIVVYANGGEFKKYEVIYDFNADNRYEFVKSITEKNSNNNSASPINFTYQDAGVENWKQSKVHDSNHTNKGFNGDFDGDGKIDLLKTEGSSIVIYKDVFGANNKLVVGTLPQSRTISTSFTIKNSQNQLLPRQGFLVFEQLSNGNNYYTKRDMVIRGYSLNGSYQMVLEFEKTLSGEKYDRTEKVGNDDPLPPGYSNMIQYTTSIVTESRDFDLDGDNLSELVIKMDDHIMTETITYYQNQMPETQTGNTVSTRYVIVQPYNSDINQKVGEFHNGSKDFFRETVMGDFDGDGKMDFMSVNGYISTFKKGENGFYADNRILPNGSLEGVFDRAVVGDFNGDGKTDLMLPQADKSSNWNLYLADGKGFVKEVKNNLAYFTKETEFTNQDRHRNIIFEAWCYYKTVSYRFFTADDLDGDGKSEFISNYVSFVDHSWNSHFDHEHTTLISSIYTTSKSDSNSITFISQGNADTFQFEDVVVPFSATTLYRNGKKVILLGKPENCGKTDCETFIFLEANKFKDIGKYSRINSITQGGLTTYVDYKELVTDPNPTFYAPVKAEQYPYMEMDKVSQSYAVSQLRQEGRKQDFLYRGLVTHLHGRGMVGFRQTARSSWYTDELVNTKIWSGAEIDPLNEGMPVKEWSIKTNSDLQVFPQDISENNAQLLSFKSTQYRFDRLLNGNIVDVNSLPQADRTRVVSATVPVRTVSKDFMRDVRTESTILYDADIPGGTKFYLPVQTTNNTNNGFAVSTTNIEYLNHPQGTGRDYYIGRPSSKNEQMSVYGDTKGAKEEYSYLDNLLKAKKSYNRDNTGWFLETYGYDGFGNITQKTATSSIDGNSKTDLAQYDAKGRFVVKKTDNLGLVTTIKYNDWGQVEEQVDPLGNKLENTYDRWGKMLTSKTNMGGTTTYVYEKTDDKDAVVTKYSPDGGKTISYTNKLGQNYRTTTKKFGQGEHISKLIVFDALGRKVLESEPFSGAYPTQWNSIEYDDYSRPVKATAFNGKVAETAYSGRIATVTEKSTSNPGGSDRFKRQVADPLGNIVSTEDLGGVVNFRFNAAGENIEANYEGYIVKTSYDAWGNKARFEDPSNGVYEYQYLGYFGALSKSKSPKGEKTYEYNSKGQLIRQTEKTTTGNATDKVTNFTYNDKGMVTGKAGTSLGKSYSSGITYDGFGRVLASYEDSNGKYFLKKGIVYDDKMRVTSYEKQLYSSGILTRVSVENEYDGWSGELYRVKERGTGKILWELKETNERGQVKKAQLGKTDIQNEYDDASGFLDYVKHTSMNADQATVLYVDYNFNAVKNELNSRVTLGDFNITEQFQYDSNNRLYNWTDPVTGAFTQNQTRNLYDNKGRITQNDQVGTIKFENASKKYQATSMVPNAAGSVNYGNDLLQQISYNENNDPVFIDGVRGDVAFEYGLTSMRQKATYGGNFAKDSQGRFTKYYSEDGGYEVIRNNQTGQEKHLIYIGGTPYESDIVFVKDYTEGSGSFKFLHKDYLGSILAITDEAGTKLEQRHFDAWGNLTHLKIGNNATITDKNQIRDYLSNGNLIVDRGYTSHEHFAEVGLVHMNGRLYDPLLKRFLNADENIQDPHNTQNYNKYGYVLNNPLMFNDPSGEFFVFGFLAGIAVKWVAGMITAAIIGSAVAVAGYVVSAIVTGSPITFMGFAKAALMGGVSGAVTFGIGQIFSTAAVTFGNALLQAGAHAVSQGVLGVVQGQDFLSSAVSGFAGSLGAAGFGAVVGKAIANSTVGTIAFGAIAGGVGAELSGGNFWQGALIGGIVAGLNHTMHKMDSWLDSGDDPPGRKLSALDARKRWQARQGGVVDVDVSTIDWSNVDLSVPGNKPGTYRALFDSKHYTNPDQAMVQGTVTFEPVKGKPGYYQIAYDGETGCRCERFDFDIKNNEWTTGSGFARNIGAIGGTIFNGLSFPAGPRGMLMVNIPRFVGGDPFTIRYNGMFKIGK